MQGHLATKSLPYTNLSPPKIMFMKKIYPLRDIGLNIRTFGFLHDGRIHFAG